MGGLSASMQNYIKAVYELSSAGEGVRISDIADKVAVTKPSACVAMKNLQEKGLVRRDADRLVFLTDKGEQQAVLMLDKFSIIQRFLVEVLGVPQKVANTDACAMEHVISIQTLCSLCRFVSKSDAKHQCEGGCHVQTQDLPKT